MKISNLLLAGLAVFGLAACSSDDSIPTDKNVNAEFDTYLTVQLATSPLSRADDPESTADDQDIASLHVYLVKNGMIQFSHSTSNLTDRKTEVFSAPEGTYNLVVVANPVGNIRTSGSISAVITAESVEAVQSGYNNGIFGMVSEMKDPDITKLGSSVTIDSSSTHGEPAKGTAKLDRLAVKIYDKTETPTIDPEVTAAVGDLTINGFLLVNSKKTFNLFQEWTNSAAGNVVGKYINSPKEDDVKDVFLPFSSYTEVT